MGKKHNLRVTKAQNYLLDNTGIDYVIKFYETPDFVEFVCEMGGDIITYRAYDKDGEISLYER